MKGEKNNDGVPDGITSHTGKGADRAVKQMTDEAVLARVNEALALHGLPPKDRLCSARTPDCLLCTLTKSARKGESVEMMAGYIPTIDENSFYSRKASTKPVDAPAILEDAGAPAAPPADDWRRALRKTKKGKVENTFGNVCKILRHAPEYATLRYDEMNLTPVLHGRPVTDAGMGSIRESVEHLHEIAPAAATVAEALVTVSKERSFHPVREYLNGLVWDGVERINALIGGAMPVKALPINVKMLRAWFISTVARPMDPGCKVDTALVLSGPQGVQKSGFFRVLGGPWFSDTAVNLDSKDTYQQLRAAWIYEWGEIEHITSRAHAGKVKAFVASQVDAFRPPFMRTVESFPRGNVIVGSTNEDQFLNDPTGSRRFLVLYVSGRIDIEAVARDRDQLWAEAVAAYKGGEEWWLSVEDDVVRARLSDAFRVTDPWEAPIATWVAEHHVEVITSEKLLTKALRIVVGDQTQASKNRVAAVMKVLGYVNRPVWVDGHKTRVWTLAPVAKAPAADPPPAPTAGTGNSQNGRFPSRGGAVEGTPAEGHTPSNDASHTHTEHSVPCVPQVSNTMQEGGTHRNGEADSECTAVPPPVDCGDDWGEFPAPSDEVDDTDEGQAA